MRNPNALEIRYLNQFVGKTIKQVSSPDLGDGLDLAQTLDFTDGTHAVCLCDAEGNGPGHLSLCSSKTGMEIHPK